MSGHVEAKQVDRYMLNGMGHQQQGCTLNNHPRHDIKMRGQVPAKWVDRYKLNGTGHGLKLNLLLLQGQDECQHLAFV